MPTFDYKSKYKESLHSYIEYQRKILKKYTTQGSYDEQTPLGLINLIGDVEHTVVRLEGMRIDVPNIDLPYEVKAGFAKSLNDYSSELNTFRNPYEQKKEQLEQNRLERIKQTKEALEEFKVNKKYELEEQLKVHNELNYRKAEIEELLRMYQLDADAYATPIDDMPLDELCKSSQIALDALNTVTRNPRIVRKIVRLAYLPLEVDMHDEKQNLLIKVSWLIAFLLLCYVGRPYFLALIAICYFANSIANILDARTKKKILQMAYSYVGEVDVTAYVEDCPKYYDLLADIEEAEDADIEGELKELDEEADKREQEIKEANPEKDLDAVMKEVSEFIQTDEYSQGLEDAKRQIEEERDTLLEQYSERLEKLKNILNELIASTKPLGTYIPLDEYFHEDIKIGSITYKGQIVSESTINIGNRNIIFSYDSDAKRAECIDYMKLLLANYLCNVREKHLTVSIYDNEDLGRDFVEYIEDEKIKDYIKVEYKDLGKKIETLATDILTRNKKLRGLTINEYNKEAQSIGKLTLDYEIIIIISTEFNYVTDKKFRQFIKYSYDKGIMIWVLQKDESFYTGNDAETGKAIKDMKEDADLVTSYGEYEIDHEVVSTLPEGYKQYRYTEDLGRQVIKTMVANMDAKDRHAKAIMYEEDFREKYIPDDKIWTYDTLKGIDFLFGLQDGDPEKPIRYTIGDNNVHGLMGGTTGSGKSATLNQLLASLLYMYSPEELELFMIDFKNIEFKMYTGEYALPHASIIAGTTDGAYALSIFDYAMEVMEERNIIFGKYGVQKLEDYNKKVIAMNRRDLYIPRILIIIDEFQAMFTEVDEKSLEKIKNRIKSLTKKARSCGVHLFFTSQSMQGTMSADILSNFTLRAALRCSSDTSISLIGSNASALIKEKQGWININDTGGERPEETKLFRIPFIPGDQIHSYIKKLKQKCEDEGHIDRHPKYYNEEDRYNKDDLIKVMDTYQEQLGGLDTIVLGERTTFSTKVWPDNFNIFDNYDENIIYASFERKSQCMFIDSMLTQFNHKGIPVIVHCPDLELAEVIGLKEQVQEQYYPFIDDSLDFQDIIAAVADAIEDRKQHPEHYNKPTYFMCLDWDNISGVGRGENSRLTAPMQSLIHEGPRYGFHFILVVSRFKEMRMWKQYFKHTICGYCENTDSNYLLDSNIASKLKDGFGIYAYASDQVKYKTYDFDLVRDFRPRRM